MAGGEDGSDSRAEQISALLDGELSIDQTRLLLYHMVDGEGFKTLERWLGTHDALFLWRDRAAPLVVVPLHVWLELIGRGLPAPQVKS
jgi:hypothetical protein